MNRVNISNIKRFLSLPKEVWIGWVSSLTEAYNMAIYSFIAPLLARLIFPLESNSEAILFSYIIPFVGLGLLYPMGAIYYGFIGDKHGRQKTCVYSTLGLAIATGLMGFAPFEVLGDKSWLYFLILICAQNFFSGGEYYGSIVFSLEHTEQKENGLMSSMSCLFAVFGLIFANGLASLSILTQNLLWIRICFLIGALGGVISYLLKNSCNETPVFLEVSQDRHLLKKTEIFSFIKREWSKILGVILILALFLVIYSFIFIFLPLIKINENGNETFDTFKSLFIYGAFLVFSGYASNLIGVKKVMLLGSFLLSLVLLSLGILETTDLMMMQILLTIPACFIIGPMHSWILNEFNANERCRGIFISSAIATSLFAGSTVPFCLVLHEYFNSLMVCCLCPLTFSVLSCFFLFKRSLKERNIQSELDLLQS